MAKRNGPKGEVLKDEAAELLATLESAEATETQGQLKEKQTREDNMSEKELTVEEKKLEEVTESVSMISSFNDELEEEEKNEISDEANFEKVVRAAEEAASNGPKKYFVAPPREVATITISYTMGDIASMVERVTGYRPEVITNKANLIQRLKEESDLNFGKLMSSYDCDGFMPFLMALELPANLYTVEDRSPGYMMRQNKTRLPNTKKILEDFTMILPSSYLQDKNNTMVKAPAHTYRMDRDTVVVYIDLKKVMGALIPKEYPIGLGMKDYDSPEISTTATKASVRTDDRVEIKLTMNQYLPATAGRRR